MCGIAGFNFDDPKLVRRMCKVMEHRGPDEEGYYGDNYVSLGNNRLSIIDLYTGKQPIHNENGDIWITHSGEIYNFLELREALEKKGHRFYTKTDTEVLVHLYEEHDESFVKKLNGMFAFAIWDSNKKKLILARDRSGIKPLYYDLLADGSLLFASEVKAILQYERVKRRVDLQAFHYFVNLRYVPGERTMFQEIKKLLPGHIMIVEKKSVKIGKYWDLNIRPENRPENYWVKKLRKLIRAAVKRHLISDVPLGIYLSGGLDTSTLVATASKLTDEPIKTFCMGFGEDTDETEDARYVANHFGTDHHELIVEANLLKDYPKIIWHADAPKRNLFPYYIAQQVKKHAKVVLDGLGGDELFGGYDWKYQFARDVEEERKRLPRKTKDKIKRNASLLIKNIAKYGSLEEIEHLHNLKRFAHIDKNADLYLLVQSLDEVFDEASLKEIYSKKMLGADLLPVKEIFEPYFSNDLSFVDQVLLTDYKVKMTDDFLFVGDVTSMANSVESRVPFLDNELVEFAFTIPSEFKLRNGVGKYIIRKAMSSILPKKIIKKEKRGFGTDVFLQYKKEIKEYAMQRLPEGNAVKEGFIKKEYVEKVLNHALSPDLVKHYTLICNLLTFEIWYDIFIKSDSIRKPIYKKINAI